MSRRIVITLPDWLPTKDDFVDLYRTTKFYITRPFRCADCNIKLLYKNPEYHIRNGNKCMIHSVSSDEALCKNCLAKRISKFFSLPEKYKSKEDIGYKSSYYTDEKCDCCKNTKKCAMIITEKWLNIRFGTQWWNGFWLCEDCLVNTVSNGNCSTSYMKHKHGKTYARNEVGALIFIGKGFIL